MISQKKTLRARLIGTELTLLSIRRQNVIDADFVHACDNCGAAIVNYANVEDASGKQYVIGLDCKKTLIDKKHIEKILSSGGFSAKYDAKEYKKQTGQIEKFLKLVSDPENKTTIDRFNSIYINDNRPSKTFEGVTGNCIYIENLGYLYKIGLKDFIQDLAKEGKIQYERY